MESKELEALRTQILKVGKVRMASVTISQKMCSNGTSSPIKSKNQEIVEIGIDDLMALVTAEVERAYQTGWREGVAAEIECVEKSGEHLELQKGLQSQPQKGKS